MLEDALQGLGLGRRETDQYHVSSETKGYMLDITVRSILKTTNIGNQEG